MGHKGMEWDVVARVIERARLAITDILLNFYITRIDVHAGYLRSTAPAAAEFVKRLDALFGTDEWRDVWAATEAQEERMIKLSDLYMRRLHRAFSSASPGAGGAVAARYPVRTLDGKLKYFIMHGTRHRRGGRAMSDAVFRVTMEYEDAKAEAKRVAAEEIGQLSLLPPASLPTEKEIDDAIIARLVPDILTRVPRGKWLTLADVEDALLGDWFGRAVTKHYRRACIQLIKENKATLRKHDTTKPSRGVSVGDEDRVLFI